MSDALEAPVEHSKRWNYFYSALQLAIQRSATKWTLEDLADCFPTYAKETREGLSEIRLTIGQQMESTMQEAMNECLAMNNVADGIDALDAVLRDARARKAAEAEQTPDVWQPSLEPSAMARARTVPLLEKERDALVARLEELTAASRNELAEFRQRTEQRIAAEQQAEHLKTELKTSLAALQSLPAEELEVLVMNSFEAGGIISSS